MQNGHKDKKNVSVTVDKNIKVNTYDLFLAKTNDEYMEVQLCHRKEDDESVELIIDNVFRINADRMYAFALEIVNSLPEFKDKNEKKETSANVE